MMYKIYGENDTFLYQTEQKPEKMRCFELYYLGSKNKKVANENYNKEDGLRYLSDQEKELKKLAPHEEKIDVTHENYDYQYARIQEYGPLVDQVHFITENGLDAWQAKVTKIKLKLPKK